MQEYEEVVKNYGPEADYTKKFQIILNAAPCDVLKAELVGQLNQERDYDDLLKKQNLGMIRIKAFENNSVHKKLL